MLYLADVVSVCKSTYTTQSFAYQRSQSFYKITFSLLPPLCFVSFLFFCSIIFIFYGISKFVLCVHLNPRSVALVRSTGKNKCRPKMAKSYKQRMWHTKKKTRNWSTSPFSINLCQHIFSYYHSRFLSANTISSAFDNIFE